MGGFRGTAKPCRAGCGGFVRLCYRVAVPSVGTRRGPIAILLGTSLMVASCGPAQPDNTVAPGNAGDPVLNLPSMPLPDPPLDRAGLLAAITAAASAEASGANDADAQRA